MREVGVVGIDVVCGDACALWCDAGKLDVGSLRHAYWYCCAVVCCWVAVYRCFCLVCCAAVNRLHKEEESGRGRYVTALTMVKGRRPAKHYDHSASTLLQNCTMEV